VEARRGPIEVAVKRTTYTVGLVVSAFAFVVCAFWVLPQLGMFPPVVVGAAMTAVGFVTFAYLLATGPYVFRIDARGIHDRSGVGRAGKLAWEDLEDVRVVQSEGRAQIGIVLTAAARERASVFSRGLLDEQRRELGVDVVIVPEAMGPQAAAEHVALLKRFLTSKEARAELE
jgi:hypothetical protein